MIYTLYGRLRGRGRELTVTGTKDTPVSAQLETRNGAIRVTLHPNGCAKIELGRKYADKALPDRWVKWAAVDVDKAALS